MSKKLPIEEISRQPLVRGTMCFTDPSGDVGFKNEDIQLSALVRIAAALERQTAPIEESRWIAVEVKLPPARPDNTASWAVLAVEYTGSQVLVSYNWSTGQWDGLDYEPRITHWQPLPKGPHQEGGQADD